MASSTLDPDYSRVPDRKLGSGHGTHALGPSDTSDSGSDMQGIGFGRNLDIGLDQGTYSDPGDDEAGAMAGADVGDADLDSDSDSFGTGERAAAGRNTLLHDGQDIDTDRIVNINETEEDGLEGPV